MQQDWLNLTTKADLENISIYDAITSGKELEFKKIIEKLIDISKDITLTELIDKVLDASGLRAELEAEKSLEAEVRLENLEEFKSITKSFEEREGLVSLEDFLLEISLISDVEEYKDDPNRISLMTVHSVKGLEFDHVFVIGMEEGIFPHSNSFIEEGGLEEERRLCYVGITRAKKKLHLTNTFHRMLYGQTSYNKFTGKNDPNRIFSADGTRSIRFDDHEMKSLGTRKAHFHYEVWDCDPLSNTVYVTNTIQRMR